MDHVALGGDRPDGERPREADARAEPVVARRQQRRVEAAERGAHRPDRRDVDARGIERLEAVEQRRDHPGELGRHLVVVPRLALAGAVDGERREPAGVEVVAEGQRDLLLDRVEAGVEEDDRRVAGLAVGAVLGDAQQPRHVEAPARGGLDALDRRVDVRAPVGERRDGVAVERVALVVVLVPDERAVVEVHRGLREVGPRRLGLARLEGRLAEVPADLADLAEDAAPVGPPVHPVVHRLEVTRVDAIGDEAVLPVVEGGVGEGLPAVLLVEVLQRHGIRVQKRPTKANRPGTDAGHRGPVADPGGVIAPTARASSRP